MAFWKPGSAAPGVSASSSSSSAVFESVAIDRDAAAESAAHGVAVYNAWARLSLAQQRARLPIAQHVRDLVYALEQRRTLIVVGATGSGKSTQLVQFLLEAGWCSGGRMVACTQPRRIAAMSLAARVAEERGCALGGEVGYAVRFDECADSVRTRIKFVTDGVLLRELQQDPLLQRYSVVVVDEAHERSVASDLCMALLKKVQRRRPELRVVLASATLDVDALRAYWGDDAALVVVEGRQHAVAHHFLTAPCESYVTAAAEAVWQIHLRCPPGAVLVFLPGYDDIMRVIALLDEREASARGHSARTLAALRLAPIALYAGQSASEQLRAFEPSKEGARKVVVSTNVAETSVTLPDIVYVVDSGLVKQRLYNADRDDEALAVVPVTRAAATQRAGRAGRVRPGHCFHLYTHRDYLALAERDVPEMQRAALAAPLLQLLSLGVADVAHFDFVAPPPARHVARALERLHALGAIDGQCALTAVGATMALLPLPPTEAHLLLQRDSGCSEELLSIVAMLSVQTQTLFTTATRTVRGRVDAARARYAVKEGDHLTLLNIYNDYAAHRSHAEQWCAQHALNARTLARAHDVRQQLRGVLRRHGVALVSAQGDVTRVLRALVRSYFMQAAQRQSDGSYRTLRADTPLQLHPSSVLFAAPPEWLLFHEVLETNAAYMRECSAIDAQWLTELAPHYYALRTGELRPNPSAAPY